MDVYNYARSNLDDWESATAGTFAAMLLKTGAAFDIDNQFVDDLTPGSNEVTSVGYARVDLVGFDLQVNTTDDATYFVATRPDFGVITTGQTVVSMVVYRRAVATVDTDTTSTLLGWQDLNVDTAASSPFRVVFPSNRMFKAV